MPRWVIVVVMLKALFLVTLECITSVARFQAPLYTPLAATHTSPRASVKLLTPEPDVIGAGRLGVRASTYALVARSPGKSEIGEVGAPMITTFTLLGMLVATLTWI